MVKLSDLFEIRYGNNLELNKLNVRNKHVDGETVNFVSRTRKNNGVSAIVEIDEKITPIASGVISVALGSDSVMESFIQPSPFYSGRDVCYLIPKVDMDDNQKIFYCNCLRENKFRFNYGRQANKTLKDLEVPSLQEIPKWIYEVQINEYENIKAKEIDEEIQELNFTNWEKFKYSDLFYLERGKQISKTRAESYHGTVPFVTSSEFNNGVTCYTSLKPIYKGNMITIANNGSVGVAFYQESEFIANSDVTILKPINEKRFNKYVAFFIIILIELEKFRFNYGRKWTLDRMKNSIIKLPVDINKQPDYEFMEKYIKKISYSKYI